MFYESEYFESPLCVISWAISVFGGVWDALMVQ